MKSQVLAIAVGILASALVTGATSWLVFGQDKVTRADMIDYVQHQSPWIVERGEVRTNVKVNTSNVEKLGVSVEKLVAAQRELLVEQRILVHKFNQVVEARRTSNEDR